jgi:N-acetylmuramoyl-L-alanine amidase
LVLIAAAAVIAVLVLGIRAIWHKPDASNTTRKTPAVVVVIDPAHGGNDKGANAEGVFAKDITLAVANKMVALDSEFPSMRIVVTRSTDSDMAADDRIAVASDEAAQLFVALDVNAAGQATAFGIETLVDSTHKSGDACWSFASAMQKAVVATTAAKDRDVKAQGARFARLTIPAAAVYVGFVTTPEERAKMTDPAYQDLIARGLLQGIANYISAAGVTPVSSTQTVPLAKGQTATPAGASP